MQQIVGRAQSHPATPRSPTHGGSRLPWYLASLQAEPGICRPGAVTARHLLSRSLVASSAPWRGGPLPQRSRRLRKLCRGAGGRRHPVLAEHFNSRDASGPPVRRTPAASEALRMTHAARRRRAHRPASRVDSLELARLRPDPWSSNRCHRASSRSGSDPAPARLHRRRCRRSADRRRAAARARSSR